ncbi:MAG: hypothetical protein V4764_00820 [Burkholderia sp.]
MKPPQDWRDDSLEAHLPGCPEWRKSRPGPSVMVLDGSCVFNGRGGRKQRSPARLSSVPPTPKSPSDSLVKTSPSVSPAVTVKHDVKKIRTLMAKRIFTKSLLFSGIAFLLAGCATPYQKSSLLNVLMPGGFAETQIDDTTFNVRFAGNGNTLEEKIGRYLLYRCAELTRERGFRYFVLVPRGFTGGVSLNDRLRDSPNRPEMVKVRSSGHLVIIPGAISSEVRKKSLTIFMFQNPKAVPYRCSAGKRMSS